MKLLLDTHILLWGIFEPAKLPRSVSLLITDPEHDVFFSVISLWEIGVKQNLGRPEFQVNALSVRSQLLKDHYIELPLTGDHVLAVGSLPLLHKDPFDRLLVCQALTESMTLVTNDRIVAKYPAFSVLL